MILYLNIFIMGTAMKKASFDDKKVMKICNGLVAQGIEPTIKAVTEKLGGGSPNLVLQHIRQWRKEYELAHAVQDDLSPEFRQAALAECARKLVTVRENLQKHIEEREATLNELQDLLENAEAQIEELNSELLQNKKEAEAKHLDYEAKLAAAREQIAVRSEQTKESIEKLDLQATKFQEQIRQLQDAKHHADIKAAAAEARNTELEKQIARKH